MKNPTEYLKCNLTDAEITDAAKELARSTQSRARHEQRKKEIDSAIKADIEAENSSILRLSNYINTGFEYRDVDIRIELDTPEKGKKRVVRLDTGEEVKIVSMTDEDKQASLDLQAEADSKDEQKEPIVPEPPQILQIESGTGEPLIAPAVVMGGTHQRKGRKPRDPEQEAQVDGSQEVV